MKIPQHLFQRKTTLDQAGFGRLLKAKQANALDGSGWSWAVKFWLGDKSNNHVGIAHIEGIVNRRTGHSGPVPFSVFIPNPSEETVIEYPELVITPDWSSAVLGYISDLDGDACALFVNDQGVFCRVYAADQDYDEVYVNLDTGELIVEKPKNVMTLAYSRWSAMTGLSGQPNTYEVVKKFGMPLEIKEAE